ncbi:MAG: nitrous oxide reductase accessory protein NosL [Thermodesulfobacteriota bacterium]
MTDWNGRLVGMVVTVLLVVGLAVLSGTWVQAEDPRVPDVEHPIMKPAMFTDKGKCENCGMGLNMWARTRHSFRIADGEHHVCSLHCLADVSAKAGEKPQAVMAAVYLAPEKMVDAASASYVVGSTARGTMSMVSKIAFASRDEAEAFSKEYGGEVQGFAATLDKAMTTLPEERLTIAANRLKKGKIVEATLQDACVTCGMKPAQFPKHSCQLITRDGQRLHFCSTSCLVRYLDNPADFGGAKEQVGDAWVTVYPEGGFDYASGLYYLVGSSVMGSMGPEALPFRLKAAAEALAKEKGGQVVRFQDLTSLMIRNGK